MAETILKIGVCTDEFIQQIKKVLLNTREYYLIRNILLILNKYDTENFRKLIDNLDISIYDERTNIFIDWIYNNENTKLIEETNMLPDEITDMYRDLYPVEETYSGYKSL